MHSKTENKHAIAKIFLLKSFRNTTPTVFSTDNYTDTDQGSRPLFPKSVHPEFEGFLFHVEFRSSVFLGSECFSLLDNLIRDMWQSKGSKGRILESFHKVRAVQTWWISSIFLLQVVYFCANLIHLVTNLGKCKWRIITNYNFLYLFMGTPDYIGKYSLISTKHVMKMNCL